MEKMPGVAAPQGSTYDPFQGNKQDPQAHERKPISEGITQAHAQGMSGVSASAEASRKVDQSPKEQAAADAEDRVLDSVVGAAARSESAEPRAIPEVDPSVIAAKDSPAARQAAQPESHDSDAEKKTEHRRADRRRQIKKGVFVDVFDVIRAFGVTCPAQMAVLSNLLMADPRDLEEHYLVLLEAQDNLERAIELMEDEMGIQSSLS